MVLPTFETVGLCSWSVQPASPDELIEKVRAAGLSAVQLALEPLRSDPTGWADTRARLDAAGIAVHSGMFEPVGEDYSSPATIRATGGIVPDNTWEENQQRVEQVSTIAAELGLTCVTFHTGFIPEEPDDPKYAVMVDRLRHVADRFGEADITQVLLETGQEHADTLLAFLEAVNHRSVGINFDPANMLLYNMDEPIDALRKLLPHVRQVHLKDANRPQADGQWGEEVVVGTGQVDWPAFCRTLAASAFSGKLIFEREAGDDRVGDIRRGAAFIRPLLEGGAA